MTLSLTSGLVGIGLLVVVALLWKVGMSCWRHLRALKQPQAPLTVVRQLSEHQQFLLRSQIPTPQLELFDEVLLVSLGFLHELLSTLSSSTASQATHFEEKLATLIALLKRARHHPLFLNQTVTERSRNNALFVFVFYRVLYAGVFDKALAEGVLSADTDPFILLKRIPAKVSTFFGGQVWRLYELTTLVHGELTALTVNHDLRDVLADLVNEAITPVMSQPAAPFASSEGQGAPIIPPAPDEPQRPAPPNVPPLHPTGIGQAPLVGVSGSLPTLPSVPTRLTLTTLVQGNAVASAPTELTPTPAVEPSVVNTREVCQTPDALYKKLIKWLQRQLSRYPVNSSDRFVATPDDPQVVYVSDVGLSDFAKKLNQPLPSLKTALQSHASVTLATVTLQREHDTLTLLAVPVTFTFELLQPMVGQFIKGDS